MATAKTKATRPSGEKSRTEKRPARVPLTGNVDILAVGEKDPENMYRWVNDEKGKIQKYNAAWWDTVNKSDVQLALGARDTTVGEDSPVTQQVGTDKDGKPIIAYLMRKDKKYFEEDMAAKQKLIDEQEASMFRADESFDKGQYGKVKQQISRTK